MSAQSLEVVTLVFPNPEWFNNNGGQLFQRVNASISFTYLTSFDIRTLSTNGANLGTSVTGLLYVPDLDPADPCTNLSAPYVPQNVTRQANLPNTDYDLVALAPWISITCTQSYLASARLDPIRGFMFFLPDNGTTMPPDPSNPVWNLNDGGHWKGQNNYPVYAIPDQSAQILMTASSQYSGNMTDVPYGKQLTGFYDSRYYVRLFANIDTGNGGALPSLWVFLLIVLGILVGVIGLTSLIMHWLQRRRRQSLRRRVANGEVDLEALGIKRLTVPQDLLDEMPLYTYGSGTPVPPSAARTIQDEEKTKSVSAKSSRPSSTLATTRPSSALLRSTSYHPTPLQQPTCPICLDDFVPASSDAEGTIVRELPCHHIFHPECVDTFLRDSSSLCPMCKKTALPKGYCPRVITNAMVRRERMVRRIRERVTVDAEATGHGEAGHFVRRISRGGQLRTRTFSGLSSFRIGRSTSSAATPGTVSQAMTDLPSQPTASLVRSNTARAGESWRSAPQDRDRRDPMRREWARQRAVAMLGRQAPVDPDEEESRTMPAWRKALKGIFPSIGSGRSS